MIHKPKGIKFAQVGTSASTKGAQSGLRKPSIGAAVRAGGLSLTPRASVFGIKPLSTLN